MASRFRSLSRPTISLLKANTFKSKSIPSLPTTRSYPTFSRSVPQLGCLQSMLPLHSAVSLARLNSCLSADAKGSRTLSQGMIFSANPGV